MAWVIQPGRIGYGEAWELQRRLVAQRIAGEIGNTVVVCEHDPVYTVGRKREAMANLIDPGDTPIFEVERGGDVTWHGPGQVVVYPIVRLDPLDLHAHLRRLEQLMIDVIAHFGGAAGRDPRNAGVWMEGRKVGSVGVACRAQVTWHGLALNVDPDLGGFRRVNPCGLGAELLSSLAAEGLAVSRADAEAQIIARVLDW